jgi:hypothetical protein
MTVIPLCTLLTSLDLSWRFAVCPIEDATIWTQLRWSRQNCRQCRTPSQNTTSRIHLKKWHKHYFKTDVGQ